MNALPVERQLISIERLIQVDIDLAQKTNDNSYQKGAIHLLDKVVANHWGTYKTYDNLETRNLIRDKVSKYLYKQTAKRPMILPVILEINLNK